MEPQITLNYQRNLEKKRTKLEIPCSPDFKLYYKTTVIKHHITSRKTDSQTNGTGCAMLCLVS